MVTGTIEPKAIVLVGPTASGKTDAAIEVAIRLNGEIICADSRTVYRGLDIGMAKPSSVQQARVPHHLIDLINPDETYSAAKFQLDAREKMAEIRGRGRVPIVVGGTGLYIDGLIFGYQFGPDADLEERRRLEQTDLQELISYCVENNIKLPSNVTNKRYVIRAIEQKGINLQRDNDEIENYLVAGITTDKVELRKRISNRAQKMFRQNLIEEAQIAAEHFGWSANGLQASAYRQARELIGKKITLKEASDRLALDDWHLARRQIAWFKRNPRIDWVTLGDVVERLVQ